MDFVDDVVLITGGGSGIGRAAAIKYAAAGASVMLADVNEVGCIETAAVVQEAGGIADYVLADVGEGLQVQAMVAATIAHYGKLTIAVNNAGISGEFSSPILDADEAMFDKVIRVNLKGVWLCMKAEIEAMLPDGGAIVNLASIAGLIGSAGGGAYAASKHGVVGLTRTVALEVAQQNIRVNAVCPSYVDTPMVTTIADHSERLKRMTQRASPMKRLGTPDEVAEAILWLSSDASSFVNGTALTVDGGFTAS